MGGFRDTIEGLLRTESGVALCAGIVKFLFFLCVHNLSIY